MQALRSAVVFRNPQLCRKYATEVQPPLPQLARVARTASAPLAVRLRRRKQHGPLPEEGHDSTEAGLTPTEHARFTCLKATGQLDSTTGTTPKDWLERLNERRTRIRGFKQTKEKPGKESRTLAVGQRVYLPNIIMRLVRNYTPPGEEYNPYEATFRVPQSVTKTDIRSLLQAVYGVQVTYIRTDNYISPWYRSINTYYRRPYKTYKRAVVGLVDPFYYPHNMEDMPQEQRQEREDFINKAFYITEARQQRKEELLRATMGNGRAAFKFKAPFATKKPHILRLVAERRAKREAVNAEVVKQIQALRASGEEFTMEDVKAKVSEAYEAATGSPMPTRKTPTSTTAE